MTTKSWAGWAQGALETLDQSAAAAADQQDNEPASTHGDDFVNHRDLESGSSSARDASSVSPAAPFYEAMNVGSHTDRGSSRPSDSLETARPLTGQSRDVPASSSATRRSLGSFDDDNHSFPSASSTRIRLPRDGSSHALALTPGSAFQHESNGPLPPTPSGSTDESSMLQAEVHSLQSDLHSLGVKYRRLQASQAETQGVVQRELDQQQSEIEVLRMQLEASSKRSKETVETDTAQRLIVSNLQSEIREKDDGCISLRSQLEQSRAEYETQSLERIEDAKQAQQTIAQLQAEVEHAEKTLREMTTATNNTGSVQDATGSADDMDTMLALAASHRALDEKNRYVQFLDAKVSSLRGDVQTLSAKESELKVSFANAEKKSDSSSRELEQQSAELTRVREQWQSEVATLSRQIQEAASRSQPHTPYSQAHGDEKVTPGSRASFGVASLSPAMMASHEELESKLQVMADQLQAKQQRIQEMSSERAALQMSLESEIEVRSRAALFVICVY